MRIAIFHDFLIERGGGERVVNSISNIFDSKIITSYYLPETTYYSFRKKNVFYINNIFNNLLLLNRYTKIIRAYYYFKHQLKKACEYINRNFDVALFSGFYSIYFSNYLKIPKIYYIQSEPISYVLERYSMKKIKRYIPKGIISKISELERECLKNMDVIIANSNYIKNIYEEFLEKKVDTVIYPPVNLKNFYYKKSAGYFLVVSRLYPHKRVDVVVKAFKRLEKEKLFIIGKGPLEKFIRKVAKKYKNIKYLGSVSDSKLKNLYASCEAVIYTPEKEHFGIVPVEANASGKPAIVSNEGGLKEIINREGVGVRINEPYLENLIKVIKEKIYLRSYNPRKCIENSKRFDEKVFVKKFKTIIEKIK